MRIVSLFALSVLTLSACADGNTETSPVAPSVSGESSVVAPQPTELSSPSSTVAVSPSSTVVDTVPADVAVVPPTAPSEAVAPGSLDSEVQKLEPSCEEAIAPIRALAAEFKSGLLLDAEASAVLTEALGEGSVVCSPEEWGRYQELELRGWLNAAP
jgi:hypothetical protein